MIATKERERTREGFQEIANEYIAAVFGQKYFIEKGDKHDAGWRFMVQCHHDDMSWSPMVGSVMVFENGQVEPLSEYRIQDMKETGDMFAARERGEKFARDENGFVLRRQARIQASCWTSDNIGMKIGAEGGMFLALDHPIWRFTIHYYAEDGMSPALDIIDVDAESGQVSPLSEEQVKVIAGGIGAARRVQEQTAEAAQ